MNNSNLQKFLFAIVALFTHPQSSLSWIRRGQLLTDKAIIHQTYWCGGRLPRTLLSDIFPEARDIQISLPRAFDRTLGTSITIEEACAIAVVAKSRHAKRVLEIGTFDGNTTLLISANLEEDGKVVTVDLPPDFNLVTDASTLKYATDINLTPRMLLARQYQGHPMARRVTQMYGDSASLNWETFGDPFDLIFIDGCHKEAYVRSDSHNAIRRLAPGGIIIWHDYGVIDDVSIVVDEISLEFPNLKFYAIEGTRLAFMIST